MKYQYKLLKQGKDHFPIVRMKKNFLFWGEWMKIIKKGARFELVSFHKLIYPDTPEKCKFIISQFKIWIETQTFINLDD